MQPITWVLASNNPGKVREMNALLAPAQVVLRAQSEWAVPECPEPHRTFVENCLDKARHAARLTGIPALADDSGLCVPSLGGLPGVDSAVFAQTQGGAVLDDRGERDRANNQQLIQLLDERGAFANSAMPRAYFVCVLVLVQHEQDPLPWVLEGRWQGHICRVAQGEGGFGYDPHFWLAERACSAAQLTGADKNLLSHRGRAAHQLINRIKIHD
jgi:XTP/dITP diphosphohydrolase